MYVVNLFNKTTVRFRHHLLFSFVPTKIIEYYETLYFISGWGNNNFYQLINSVFVECAPLRC